MSMLDALCMYMGFAFGWCSGGCKSVGAILVIARIFMLCDSHYVVMVLRIFVVVDVCEM